MNHRLASLVSLNTWVILLATSSWSHAGEVKMLSRPNYHAAWTQVQVEKLVSQVTNIADHREIRVQVFADHMVLQLLKIGFHRADFVRLNIDKSREILSVEEGYQYTTEDLKILDQDQQPLCPDPSVQFIAFAPNDDSLEQEVTLSVIQAAQAKGYKVVSLLKQNATRLNYLAYMSCPLLVGNFYDGDSNPQSFITVDGIINASEFNSMPGLFRYHVTNIWVACEAFHDPMFSAVTKIAQSQKYAAGINDLLVGPSDRAAACAMIAAMDGQPMTQAFQDCYKKWDSANDKWGFAGDGSDYFAQ